MKSSFLAISAVLCAATFADSATDIAYAADSFNTWLQCGPLTNHQKVIEKGFSARIKAYNNRGRLRAARYLKSTPGRELFEGDVDANGDLSISGEGAFDDPSRHTWTYQFRGPIAKGNETVLEGGLYVKETGATRECRFILDAESGKALLASAIAGETSVAGAPSPRVALEPRILTDSDAAPGARAEGRKNAFTSDQGSRVPLEPSSEDSRPVEDSPEPASAAPRKSAETGFDAFAHLVELPPACDAVEKFGPQSGWPRGWARETRDPFSGGYSSSDICKKITECLPSLVTRFAPLVNYLRGRPLVYAALKRESKPSPVMSVEAAVEAFGSKADLSISDCSLYAVKLDSLMARSGADPGHSSVPAPFEFVQSAALGLIADLRDEHGLRDESYSEWLPYAKHYDRTAELGATKQSYERAFAGPDLEPLLQSAQALDEEMAKASAFRNMLAKQEKRLAELSDRLADLAQRAGGQPLSKLIKPTTNAAIPALKTKVDDLANIGAAERGDVSTKISEFTAGMAPAENDIKNAQDRLDAMLPQGSTLADMNSRLIDLSKRASQNPVSPLIKPSDLSAIKDLDAEVERLAQVPVPERGDVSGQLAELETRIGELQSDVKDAEDKAAAIAKDAREKAVAAAAAKANADMRAKGVAYARESATTWEMKRTKNEMTDKIDAIAVSVQQPAPGVEAEITASCPDSSTVIFSALITDDNGKPTVTIPTDDQDRISVMVRKNDNPSLSWNVPSSQITEGFLNKLTIGSMLLRPTPNQLEIQRKLSQLEADADVDQVQKQLILQFGQLAVGGSTALDPNTAWRSMIQIGSSAGPLLLKIPLYVDAIQNVISACSGS